MAETYNAVTGVWSGPRGVVIDMPLTYSFFSTAATFNAIAAITTPGNAILLHTVTISPVATATIQIFDNTTAVGALVFDGGIMAAGNPFTVTLDAKLLVGLSMIIGVAAMNVTLCWRTK